MNTDLNILSADLLEIYKRETPAGLQEAFDNLEDAEISTDTFSFYTSVSSVFSSKIEGEEIELDSYVKHKKYGIEFLPDYTRKIDDLYNAYIYAQGNTLNKENIEHVHILLSRHIVAKNQQGKFRVQNMYVTTPNGRIEYIAATPDIVAGEMEKLYADISVLLDREMDIYEVFFFAAMIHLVFVKIHPWNDGNGRSARLIEKWFLAQKFGPKAWYMQSEKYYYDMHQTYYNNIRALGLEYPELDYSKSLPFLLKLPQSIIGIQE
jgi:Fic family protein